jgi:hypothetical protein
MSGDTQMPNHEADQSPQSKGLLLSSSIKTGFSAEIFELIQPAGHSAEILSFYWDIQFIQRSAQFFSVFTDILSVFALSICIVENNFLLIF